MLAGNVLANVDGTGTLNLIGDAKVNNLDISYDTTAGAYVLTGVNTTLQTALGNVSSLTLTAAGLVGFTGAINASLGAGNDVVTVNGASGVDFDGSLTVNGDAGNDSISIGGINKVAGEWYHQRLLTAPGAVSTSKNYSSFKLEIYAPKENEPARLGNAPTVTTRVGLRLHGMVSRLFPKLSYRLKLEDDTGQSQGRSLLGMPADADWVLQGPWLDKSLIRNAFSYDLAKGMGCAAMRTRPCEVFLSASGKPVTEADYIGVYQLTEHIERGAERVNVTNRMQTRNPPLPADTCWAGMSAKALIFPSGNQSR
jgi:hypothetical protein